jgi:hypothetical protein
MIHTVKILATLAELGSVFGLFTEADLTGRTVVVYCVFFVLILFGIWL